MGGNLSKDLTSTRIPKYLILSDKKTVFSNHNIDAAKKTRDPVQKAHEDPPKAAWVKRKRLVVEVWIKE